ncbi:hypothetical protein F2Q69_00050826 [Brassica cretica]|uniref:AMP-dependent synthetase/ligase domain-containing protein n=1 Tax=Brassica cretica TaxID=69181 RepID=A0A8S9Q4B5_BRACR|nr:hypothetical protein F2Q69_00050826 [Brassica cretica]
MDNLALCEANNAPLTPITFLKRASEFYPNRTSIIYGETRFTWPQTYDRCCRLAASLLSLNIAKNDIVSVLAPNIPAIYEMHFAVPMAGAVLKPINTRLDAKSIAAIFRHAQPKILFVDRNLETLARATLHLLPDEEQRNLLVIFIDEPDRPKRISSNDQLDYEELIRRGEPSSSSVAGTFPVYLWTLPMFHCNGWNLTWSVAARGGTNVCIRHVSAPEIYKNIELHGVTHMCCVPTVLNILLQGNPLDMSQRSTPVQVLTGGSSPPAALVEKVQRLGFQVLHVYGLTEATGAVLFCEWHDEWSSIEVENVLYKYKKVLEAAVVAMPHPMWGETPCAFVVLEKRKTGQGDCDDQFMTREGDLIKYCRENLPHFMCPKRVVFMGELPKNGNGKILKHKLRNIAKSLVINDDNTIGIKHQISSLMENPYG